jgi:lipopolysaccharide transport system ATP-binding protein
MGSSSPRISFDRVSKRYSWRRERARSFLEIFTGLLKRREPAREFWALRDLSFEVSPGEAIGLIGPNGAGKSTALKLASRVIDPTYGSVLVNGTVSGLLELAAGFHPDLSGRENVFLSGALMGLSRREMQALYGGIVEFSGIGDFVDTPVKHYSSGMAMRLGFAIASSVDPAVLLIDEVLAVGDRSFNQRCMDRVFSLRDQGTAVLLVSHDLEAVRSLCDRAVLLEHGQTVQVGRPEDVVNSYLQRVSASEHSTAALERREREERWGSGELHVDDVWLEDADGARVPGLPSGSPFTVAARYTAKERLERPTFGLAVKDHSGYLLSGPNTRFDGLGLGSIEGQGVLRYRVSSSPLQEGHYFLSLGVYDERMVHAYDHWEYCLSFDVYPGPGARCYGPLSLHGEWDHRSEAGETAVVAEVTG